MCGTWDNVTLNLYVDGKLDASINPYDKYVIFLFFLFFFLLFYFSFILVSIFLFILFIYIYFFHIPFKLILHAETTLKDMGVLGSTVMWAYRSVAID